VSDEFELYPDTWPKPRVVEVPAEPKRRKPDEDETIDVEGLVDERPPMVTDREKDERNLVAEFQIWAVERVLDAERRAIAEEFSE
jgi:hypothetical protein